MENIDGRLIPAGFGLAIQLAVPLQLTSDVSGWRVERLLKSVFLEKRSQEVSLNQTLSFSYAQLACPMYPRTGGMEAY